MEELKPMKCGCGGASNIVKRLSRDYSVPVWYVECIKCNIETDDYFSEAEAVEAWNRAMGGSAEEKLKAFWDGIAAEMRAESAEPKERSAKVENIEDPAGLGAYGDCSECGAEVTEQYAYCPNCGCRLEWK